MSLISVYRNNPYRYGNNPYRYGNNPYRYGNNPYRYGNNPYRYGKNMYRYGNNPYRYGNNPYRYGKNMYRYGNNMYRYNYISRGIILRKFKELSQNYTARSITNHYGIYCDGGAVFYKSKPQYERLKLLLHIGKSEIS
jgi:hypothetical protein